MKAKGGVGASPLWRESEEVVWVSVYDASWENFWACLIGKKSRTCWRDRRSTLTVECLRNQQLIKILKLKSVAEEKDVCISALCKKNKK